MASATMAGVPGIKASDPGLAKLIYGFCGLPCGLLLTATTVCMGEGKGGRVCGDAEQRKGEDVGTQTSALPFLMYFYSSI